MLYLRPLVLSDLETYVSWGRDQRFCEHAGWTVGRPEPELEAHWRRLITTAHPELIRLAAVLDDEVVGYVDLHGDDPDSRELGYVVGPSSRWGHGLGAAVARLGLERGFLELGLQEIHAEALDANAPSIRILIKLGMTETGRGGDEPFLGTASHYRQFSITAEAFAGLCSSPAPGRAGSEGGQRQASR